ncbi:MAG: ATP-binding cassette domain-containing protein [Defluviitaleaceae bacterium]|nr:ATP-binding cassette domain-containing protein [Defluviitaleaceae bacterium]
MPNNPQLELKNIYKAYTAPVLKDFSFVFQRGITFITGASGVGKTTLVNIIAGLEKPDSGEVVFSGGKKISMVFQEDRLLEWKSALDNLLFVGCSRARAGELLARAGLGLGDYLHKKTAELSGGMKRRVCICRALSVEYDVLILDEPFKGLDNKLKPQIMEMVREVAETYRKIIICITHDPKEAEFFGGKSVLIPPS